MPKNVQTTAIGFTSHASKVILKSLKAKLQQFMNWKHPDVQAGFRREKNQRSNCQHPLDHEESKGVPEKHLLHWLHESFDCGSQQTVENSSRDGHSGPPHLSLEKSICKSRSNRIRHRTTDWFKIGKEVEQGYTLSLCLFNFYAEYIMWNARLDESQARIKIAVRNINNHRYADDTILIAESKEELKSLLIRVKERVKKLAWNAIFKKLKIRASSPITSWQIEGGKVETVTDIIFLGSKITVGHDCSHEIKRYLLLGRKAMTNLDSILKSRDMKEGYDQPRQHIKKQRHHFADKSLQLMKVKVVSAGLTLPTLFPISCLQNYYLLPFPMGFL